MRINALACAQQNYAGKNLRKVNRKLNEESSPAFKGEQGQAVGSAVGMLLGIASSFVVGPLAVLAITGAGLVGGGVAGDKIEDKIDEKSEKNKKNS